MVEQCKTAITFSASEYLASLSSTRRTSTGWPSSAVTVGMGRRRGRVAMRPRCGTTAAMGIVLTASSYIAVEAAQDRAHLLPGEVLGAKVLEPPLQGIPQHFVGFLHVPVGTAQVPVKNRRKKKRRRHRHKRDEKSAGRREWRRKEGKDEGSKVE